MPNNAEKAAADRDGVIIMVIDKTEISKLGVVS